ncbi:glycosyl hydrolase [Mangrovimonas sp. YM274]|uniref:glycosyl hydrolase n=1 Tax=Mangrovimonas sp. YM274 TaxID=3070660 RepID=UPI0027DB1B52|nr:glycosyl hydrolase [Mangrovimonas sp. YM274]WMI68602.1 glycosyl hydrolase [Mangrovimonas sp. YM274]
MKTLAKLAMLTTIFWTLFNCSNDSDSDGDGDTLPKVSIAATNSTAEEPGTNSSFKLTLTGASSSATTVTLSINGSATNGEDYQTISNTATIPANTTSFTIPLTIIDDLETEGDETVEIEIIEVSSNAIIGNPNSATITISEIPEDFILQAQDTPNYMVNPNATAETVALFYNLKTLSRTKFIIGQQDAFSSFYNNNSGDSDIKKTTGSDPGLIGLDFMFITDDQNDGSSGNWFYQQEQQITSHAIEAYNKGMVVGFTWHLREPYEGEHFYTSEMTEFQKNNAFKSILPGGANHDYYKEKLNKVAEVANNMIGSDGKKVPFIFRPFHEFDGNWFWWGEAYCTAQEFKTAWQFTVTYLKDTLNVDNILFAFAPDNQFNSSVEYLSRYPGDAYVDILGMDNYGDFNNQGQGGVTAANNKLKIVSDLAKEKVKIAALTETGYFVTPGENNPISNFYSTNLYNAISENNNHVAYMMFWSNSENTYCTPVPGQSDVADFIEFTDKSKSTLESELPDMYSLP